MHERRPPSSLSSAPASARNAFTILELLVVVAILALLAGLLLPTLKATRTSAARTRELAAARQLMMGYTAYTYDHRGALLPGFAEGLPAFGPDGTDLSDLEAGQVAARYPWRLAPWLDNDLRALILDRNVLEELSQNQDYGSDFEIWVSLLPSLGINASFLGGDFGSGGLGNDLYQSLFGRVHLKRLAEARHPTRLLVFGSARTSRDVLSTPLPGGRETLEGWFRVDPPYLVERKWVNLYAEALVPSQWGQVSLRQHSRRAVVGFLDGSTGTLDETEIQDMRHWCDKADRPDWTLELQPP